MIKSFMLVTIYFTIMLFGFEHYFLINDNPGIAHNLENGFPAPFIGYIYSYILIFLYQNISDTIRWYGIFLYIAHFISLFLFIEALRHLRIKILFIPIVVLYLIIYSLFLIMIDYSGASIMLAGNTMLFLTAYWEKSNHQRTIILILVGILLFFSYSIRTSGIFLSILLAMPLSLVLIKHWNTKHAISLSAVLVCLIGADVILEKTTISNEYKQYIEFNKLRGAYHGSPQQLQASKVDGYILSKNGWSAGDMRLLNQFFFMDEHKFNIQTIKNISIYAPKSSRYDIIPTIISWINEYYYYIIILLFLCFLPIATINYYSIKISLIYLIYAFGIMILLAVFIRFPARIGIPAFLVVYGFILFIAFSRNLEIKPSIRLYFIYSFIMIIFMSLSYYYLIIIDNTIKYGIQNKTKFDIISHWLISNFTNDDIFLVEPISIRDEYESPFTVERNYPRMIYTGWNIYSPFFYHSIRPLGAYKAYEVFPKMVNNPHAYVIIRPRQHSINMVAYYLDQQLGLGHNAQMGILVVPGIENSPFIGQIWK